MTGQRFTTEPGGRAVLKVKRLNIAERLCRLTGQGIYRDSVLLEEKVPLAAPLTNAGVVGQDSVQSVVYRGRIFWLWGDTMRLSYPLGNFRTTCAWSDLPEKGRPASGAGREFSLLHRPGWLCERDVPAGSEGRRRLALRSRRGQGRDRRRAAHRPLTRGAAAWKSSSNTASPSSTTRPSSSSAPSPCPSTRNGASPADGSRWCAKARPITSTSAMPARASASPPGCATSATRPSTKRGPASAKTGPRRRANGTLDFAWRKDAPPAESPEEAQLVQRHLLKPGECRALPEDVATHQRITLHEGSVCWNAYRQRWVLIAVQRGGQPSFLGEVWYAEAIAPTGPWTRAVKIVTPRPLLLLQSRAAPLLRRRRRTPHLLRRHLQLHLLRPQRPHAPLRLQPDTLPPRPHRSTAQGRATLRRSTIEPLATRAAPLVLLSWPRVK
ncbi:MAG: hypothetical protein WDN28_12130 [Chthoniobacter sp.]